MLKRACISLACCLLVAAVAFAEKKRITLKNGRSFVGEVVEKTKDGIKVKGKLAVVFYANDQIASIESVDDPASDYAERLAKLDAKDPRAQVELGRYAMDKKLYKQAVERFEAALAIKKSDEMATLLLRQAKDKLKEASSTQNPSTPEPAAGGDGGAEKIPMDPKDLLQEDDIYRVRVEELREDDRVSVEFRNDAIERFLRKMRGVGDFRQPGFDRQFRSWPRPKQAKYILAKADRDDSIKDDILVKTDPAFMREFRGPIWRWISGNCASTNCHGAAKGQGGLKLYNYPGNNTNAEYTNFLILDSFRTKTGEQMIRRDDWERSLLLQYSLPPEQAQSRHPKKMRAAFPNRNAGAYRLTLDWIKSLSGPVHPDYRIKNRPPRVMPPLEGLPGLPSAGSKAATQPAKKVETPF